MDIIDRSNAEHYSWGDACDGWHLLKHPDVSVIQQRVPPGGGEVKHFHPDSRQLFFILAGTITMHFSDYAVTFGAGQCVHVPPLTEHRFTNSGDEDAMLLLISVPPAIEDRMNMA